jgi:RNA polymerase subunit RPABC4/transcription elongation factor Spt4
LQWDDKSKEVWKKEVEQWTGRILIITNNNSRINKRIPPTAMLIKSLAL